VCGANHKGEGEGEGTCPHTRRVALTGTSHLITRSLFFKLWCVVLADVEGGREVGLEMKRFKFEHSKVARFHTPQIKPPLCQPEHLFFFQVNSA
jgi:hypothetical protein